MKASARAAWSPAARESWRAWSTRCWYFSSWADWYSSDGLVVASCGRWAAIASMSPVSATTVVYCFRESSRVMIPLLGSLPGRPTNLVLGRLHDGPDREPELLHELLERGGRPERPHPDAVPRIADVLAPAERRGLLQRHAGPDRRRQHGVPILRRLLVE